MRSTPLRAKKLQASDHNQNPEARNTGRRRATAQLRPAKRLGHKGAVQPLYVPRVQRPTYPNVAERTPLTSVCCWVSSLETKVEARHTHRDSLPWKSKCSFHRVRGMARILWNHTTKSANTCQKNEAATASLRQEARETRKERKRERQSKPRRPTKACNCTAKYTLATAVKETHRLSRSSARRLPPGLDKKRLWLCRRCASLRRASSKLTAPFLKPWQNESNACRAASITMATR